MIYLRLHENGFDFIHDDMYPIFKTDINISDLDYEEFFLSQSIGKQYRLKKLPKPGTGLFGYVEEFIPEYVERPKSELESVKDQLKEMQIAFSELKKLIPQNTEG